MPKPSSPPRRQPASERKTARRRWNTTKCRGELSEYAFVYKAASLGFGVARPYSEGERFDFILISRGWPEGDKLWRIQVKSTRAFLGDLYRVMAQRRSRGRWVTYLPTEVDFIIAHVVPEDSWFVIPIRDIIGRMNLLFTPMGKPQKGKLDAYREAWHLLRPPKP
ncbi:MAG TPA: group I intron-associated PD-(D/E)XK endonuclease [Terriglobales bacterium]|nr:group I intron-associated PD-(D/E)XK endonuclease [Terriglobales bacterium]